MNIDDAPEAQKWIMDYGLWIMGFNPIIYYLKSIFYYLCRLRHIIGVHGDEETPVLIPNTEVKLLSGDYTARAGN